MSRFCLVLLCLAGFVANTLAITPEEISKFREVMRPIITDCGSQYGITIEQFAEARKSGTLEKLDPCFADCVFKKTGTINEKGLYDADTASEKVKKYVNDPADLEKINTIHNSCIAVNDVPLNDGDKGCERAKLLLSCLIKNKGDFSPLSP